METKTISIPVGSSIDFAIKEALVMANSQKNIIQFDFNDVKMSIHPGDTIEKHLEYWKSEQNRLREEYLNSAEYKESEKARLKQLRIDLEKLNELLSSFNSVVSSGNLDSIINWLQSFVLLSDDIQLRQVIDFKYIFDKFIQNGYKPKEFAGLPENEYNSKKVMGRYIIGQILNCLQGQKCIPPVASYFCEKYFELKD